VAYLFAGDRSGETPKKLLGGTKGTLIVDAYSGYNVVANVSRRKRAACHAHLRRYFHEALPTAPIAQEAIALILGIYRVEHDATAQEITGTKAHLRLRRQRAGPIRDELHAWMLRQKPRHPPKSPIAAAIRYALNQWPELGRFLDDARVPLDNNASERSLRRVALGRKNYLFVGDVDAGMTLTSIDFALGGTRSFEDLTVLPKLGRVAIWRTRQLEITDLAPLNRIAKLHTVELSELPRVTSLSWLTNPNVKRVVLDDMDVVLPKRPRYAIMEHDRGRLVTVRRARS